MCGFRNFFFFWELDGGWVGVVVLMDKFVCGMFYVYFWLFYYVDLNILNYLGIGSGFWII